MLTNVALKALKPGPKPYKKADGGGLLVLVQPNVSVVRTFGADRGVD